MNVPLCELKPQLQSIATDLTRVINAVIDFRHKILGPRAKREIAGNAGSRLAIVTSSEIDALQTCLMALKVGPRYRVVTRPALYGRVCVNRSAQPCGPRPAPCRHGALNSRFC
jgi:dTDP-4-amino-4,6-dideoxygalactose transaminase